MDTSNIGGSCPWFHCEPRQKILCGGPMRHLSHRFRDRTHIRGNVGLDSTVDPASSAIARWRLLFSKNLNGRLPTVLTLACFDLCLSDRISIANKSLHRY